MSFQTYVEGNRNIALNGEGQLVITARETDDGGYTSARMRSTDAAEFQRGRFVARIKLHSGRGLWPAFWLLGANYDEVGWPACRQRDVMEAVRPYTWSTAPSMAPATPGESIGNTFAPRGDLQRRLPRLRGGYRGRPDQLVCGR